MWNSVDFVAIEGYCNSVEVKPEESKVKGEVKIKVPPERLHRSIL